MPQAFLETSALIELIFGNRDIRKKVEDCILGRAEVISSRYVIYELAKGFLRYLILLHNKSQALTKFSELIEYSQAIRYRPHFQGTVLGSIKLFLEAQNIGNSDEERLIVFRSFIRGRIRRGWRDITRRIAHPLNDIGCRHDLLDPVIENGLYKMELKTNLCGINRNCDVKRFAATNRVLLAKIRDALKLIHPADAETQARIPSLRELYRNPNDNFKGGDCWRSGDALITVEAPIDAVLVTKNKKHIDPISKVAGQPCVYF